MAAVGLGSVDRKPTGLFTDTLHEMPRFLAFDKVGDEARVMELPESQGG